jgi:hypothetical protein
VKIVRPRVIAAVALCLTATALAVFTPGAHADVTAPAPVIWGYSYITVDSVWADLATDMGGTWVAVGTKGKLATSKNDGVNWSIPTLPSAVSAATFTSITHADSMWVAADLSGNILTSPDGLVWKLAFTSASSTAWTGAAYGEGIWVVFSATAAQTYVISRDRGVTWTTQTLPFGFTVDEVAYGNGVWVAVGSGSVERNIVTTEDGVTWDWVRNENSNWSDVEFGLGTFVAMSASGGISTSTDGRTWTGASYPLQRANSGTTWTSVTAGPDGFMAVGFGTGASGFTEGLSAYSADAITWKPTPIIHATWRVVQADDDGFVALGYYLTTGQTVVVRGALGAPSSAGGFAVSPWVQSFARTSAAMPCPPGWAGSWAEWPNERRGGFVCERTIANSATHGGWMVFAGGQWWDVPDSIYRRG